MQGIPLPRLIHFLYFQLIDCFAYSWYCIHMNAAALLSLALTLLIAAQQPNVPQSLKDQAINVARTAISAASGTSLPVSPASLTQTKRTISVDTQSDDCIIFRVRDESGTVAQEYPLMVGGYWETGISRKDASYESRRTDLNGRFEDCRKINHWLFEGEQLVTTTFSTEPETPEYVVEIEAAISKIIPSSCTPLCQGYAQSVLGQVKVAVAAGLHDKIRASLLVKVQEKRKDLERIRVDLLSTPKSSAIIQSQTSYVNTAINYLYEAELALVTK